MIILQNENSINLKNGNLPFSGHSDTVFAANSFPPLGLVPPAHLSLSAQVPPLTVQAAVTLSLAHHPCSTAPPRVISPTVLQTIWSDRARFVSPARTQTLGERRSRLPWSLTRVYAFSHHATLPVYCHAHRTCAWRQNPRNSLNVQQ